MSATYSSVEGIRLGDFWPAPAVEAIPLQISAQPHSAQRPKY